MKAQKTPVPPANPSDPLNPNGDTTDISVQVKLKGVFDANGPATGEGELQLSDRWTMNERGKSDQTWIDFPLETSIVVAKGKATFKTSYTAMMNAINVPGLQHCLTLSSVGSEGTFEGPTSGLFESIQITDPHGDVFAVPGLFMP
jgi:hypothetical protein